MGMETQTMVNKPPVFFHKKKSISDKILAIRLEALFWARNKVGCSFFLKNLGLAFGCFILISIVHWWPTPVSVGGLQAQPKAPLPTILLAIYFQPISLDSQQSSAIRSHDLSTQTAMV